MCDARIVAQPRRRPGARTYLSSRFWLCLLTLTAKGENRALEFKRASSLDLSGVLCAPSTGVCLEACRDRATDGVGPAHLAVARLMLPQSSAPARTGIVVGAQAIQIVVTVLLVATSATVFVVAIGIFVALTLQKFGRVLRSPDQPGPDETAMSLIHEPISVED